MAIIVPLLVVFCSWGGKVPRPMEAGRNRDDEIRKDLLIQQYIAREGGSIALAEGMGGG